MINQPTLGIAPGLEVKLSNKELHEFERAIFKATKKTKLLWNKDHELVKNDYITIDDLNIILKKYFNI